jgi:ABC-type dipeptide/oligopeptide/nickel transport system permease component
MAGMRAYIFKRLGLSIIVVLTATVIVFSILYLTPGDPVRLLVPAQRITPEKIDEIRHELGLDKPFAEQYVNWLFNVMRGEMGTSLAAKRGVSGMLFARLPYTLLLTVTSLIISILLGLPLGVLSAANQYKPIDHASMGMALFWLSMPGFWLGLMLMLIFGLYLGWVPISGYSGATSLILPALTLGLPQIGLLARLMRSEMLEVLRDEYIKTARAKGLKEFFVMYKHALRNAVIPVVVYLFLGIPWLISGAVVIETVFSWPGMGRLLFRSILLKDFPVVQAIILVIAILTVLFNLLGDILTGFLDPRIRYA